MTQIRSPGYPGIGLSEAIEYVEKIFEANRQNTTDREAAAKDMGYTGLTGTSAKILSDLAHFGLVGRSGKGGIHVTDVAARILHPRKQEERRAALVEAAYSPGLFRTIREQWPDGFVSDNSLRSYLMRSGFSSVALQPAMKSYLKTYAFLRQEGATESHSAPSEEEGESISEEQVDAAKVAREVPAAPKREGIAPVAGERVVFVEETSPTQYLKLIANGEMDGGLLEALEDYVKRQKKRLNILGAPVALKDEPQ